MKYDVVIVGAGSAGSVIAARLVQDSSRSVLLLEAGPDYPNFDHLPGDLKYGNNLGSALDGIHNWRYEATACDGQVDLIPIPRGKVTGGSSAVNGQILLRGLPEDYDEWARMGNSEWSFERVLPYFRKLESDRDVVGEFHGIDGPIPVRRYKRTEWLEISEAFYQACISHGFSYDNDGNLPHSTGVGPKPLNNLDGVRISTAIAYLSTVRNNHNLTIKPNTLVRRVLFDGKKRATGVEVERGGETNVIEASKVVVCAGAIGSPQLLMLSGLGPSRVLTNLGIQVVRNLPGVGQNLRDHPNVFVVFKASMSPVDILAPPVQVGLRYTTPNSSIRNNMIITPFPIPRGHRFPRIDASEDHQLVGFSIEFQRQTTAGSLFLRSADPNVQPVINYSYLSNPSDIEPIRSAIRLGDKLAKHKAFLELGLDRISHTPEELENDEKLNNKILSNVVTAHHSSGTCKMGVEDDPLAVVDQYCNVRGVENVKVVDASIMPDVIRANTNATTIMIAERAWGWI